MAPSATQLDGGTRRKAPTAHAPAEPLMERPPRLRVHCAEAIAKAANQYHPSIQLQQISARGYCKTVDSSVKPRAPGDVGLKGMGEVRRRWVLPSHVWARKGLAGRSQSTREEDSKYSRVYGVRRQRGEQGLLCPGLEQLWNSVVFVTAPTRQPWSLVLRRG